jgi:hypothetical protein
MQNFYEIHYSFQSPCATELFFFTRWDGYMDTCDKFQTNISCYFPAINFQISQNALQVVQCIYIWLEIKFHKPYSELQNISLRASSKEVQKKNLTDVRFCPCGVDILTYCISITIWQE